MKVAFDNCTARVGLMHSGSHAHCLHPKIRKGNKLYRFKGIHFLPKRIEADSGVQLGNVYPGTRQSLATAQVFSAQQEQVIQIFLLAAGRFFFI